MDYKAIPEDFIVKEVMNLPKQEKGEYAYFILRKRDWESFRVFDEVSRCAGVPLGRIGYAGLKDKRAVTEQYVSVPSSFCNKIRNLKIKDVDFIFYGYGKDRITLGDLTGNKFCVTVRGVNSIKKLDKAKRIKNLFDEQRFQKEGLAIGSALVHQDFRKACELLSLDAKGKDYVGQLRLYPRKMLRFYISVYQSWIWNTVVERVSNAKKVPLLGYLISFKNKAVKEEYRKIMKKEGITLDNFLMKPLPELAFEGGMRETYFSIKEFSYRWTEDSMHEGKFACVLEFFLPKGCYATLVVKHFFPDVKRASL